VPASRLVGVANDCKLPQPFNGTPAGGGGGGSGRGTKPSKVERLPNRVLFSFTVCKTFQNTGPSFEKLF